MLAGNNAFLKARGRFTNLIITGAWWPVFITWIVYLIADSESVRELVLETFYLSALGPFLMQWVGLFDMMMGTDWKDVMFWVMFSVVLVFTGVGMWMQLTFGETIYWWAYDYDPYEDDDDYYDPYYDDDYYYDPYYDDDYYYDYDYYFDEGEDFPSEDPVDGTQTDATTTEANDAAATDTNGATATETATTTETTDGASARRIRKRQ